MKNTIEEGDIVRVINSSLPQFGFTGTVVDVSREGDYNIIVHFDETSILNFSEGDLQIEDSPENYLHGE
jgi:hypothetical protein